MSAITANMPMPRRVRRDPLSTRAPSAVIWVCATMLASMIGWACYAPLEEVSVGTGKIVPSSKAQLVQTLEGGILQELFVAEGDIVEAGQRLATLDDTRFRSNFGETDAKIHALTAAAARLEAQIGERELTFPPLVAKDTQLQERERNLFESQRSAYRSARASLEKQLALSSRELNLTKPLVSRGAASEVEVIRLEQQVTELERKIEEIADTYFVTAKDNYTKTMAEMDTLQSVNEGRQDQLDRTVLTAPLRGIVKNLEITTLGGVIQPGGALLEIVPLEEQLLVETKINPRDIAFVRPGLPAAIKLTAYDSSIYGKLDGVVDRISPDTLVDETDKRIVYYRVYISTTQSHLTTKDGKQHAIMPGMVATAEIKTGSKTVMDYLIKPLNKMREALRER